MPPLFWVMTPHFYGSNHHILALKTWRPRTRQIFASESQPPPDHGTSEAQAHEALLRRARRGPLAADDGAARHGADDGDARDAADGTYGDESVGAVHRRSLDRMVFWAMWLLRVYSGDTARAQVIRLGLWGTFQGNQLAHNMERSRLIREDSPV